MEKPQPSEQEMRDIMIEQEMQRQDAEDDARAHQDYALEAAEEQRAAREEPGCLGELFDPFF